MFSTPAFAQATGGGGLGGSDMLVQFLPFVLIFVIMYFLIIRPQRHQGRSAHQEMIANVRRGDTVVTTGGLIGKVAKVVDEGEMQLDLAEGVRVRVVRGMIAEVRAKGEPVKRTAERTAPVCRAESTDLTCFISRAGKSPLILSGRSGRASGDDAELLLQGDRRELADWMPKRQLVLGLDLQGGAYLLYEVDQHRLRPDSACARWSATSARRCSQSRASAIPASASSTTASSSASAIPTQIDDARTRLEKLRNPLVSSLLGGIQRQRIRPDRRRRRPRPLHLFAGRARRSGSAASSTSRSRSSAAASTNSAPPSRASSARATTASWSRRRASAIPPG